jgi:hypothetical protein
MNKLEINWLSDYHDCDTCGCSYAEGAVVKLNGETIVELIPFAHCYDIETWSESEVYFEVFKKLGFDVVSRQG